jgi:NAD(P)-dependent dehydrogenase (short-subunit alcohol dehydrogenase family)
MAVVAGPDPASERVLAPYRGSLQDGLRALSGEAAIVTGAGSGIGAAVARELGRCGVHVAVLDIDQERSEAVCEELASQDGPAIRSVACECDVSDEASVQAALERAQSELGKAPTLAVNCAGIEGERAPLAEMDFDSFDRVLSTNLRGTAVCMKHEIAMMLKHSEKSECSILNITSTAGLRGMPEFAAYSASKAAIIALSKSASLEYAGQIRINCVAPATTATPMVDRFTQRWPEWQSKTNASYPIGRIATPEEVANMCVFVASPACADSTGSVFCVDGGSMA